MAPAVVLAADPAGVRSDFADLPPTLSATLYRIVTAGYQRCLQETTDGKFLVVSGSGHGLARTSRSPLCEPSSGS